MRIGWITDLTKNMASGFQISTYSGDQPGQGVSNPTHMLKQSLFNSVASGCIYMIAQSMSEAKLKVYRKTPDGGVEADDHWMVHLMERPNPFLSNFELWELIGIYMNTTGAAYFELIRMQDNPVAPVVEMYPLRSDRMDVELDQKRFIRAYRYRPENASETVYQPHQILRVAYLDPMNLAHDISPASRAAQEIDIDYKATRFTHKFLANYGVPPGILKTDQELTPDQANEIEERWWQKFNPFRGNFGRIPVLGKGSDFKSVGQNLKDLEFESLRAFVESRICAAFRVDPVLLPSWVGIRHGGKYSNYSEARRHLWDETIIPLLRRIESRINATLLAHETDYYVEFDLSKVQALQENQTERVNRMRALYESEIATLNEAREGSGLDPIGSEGDRFKGEIQTERMFQQSRPDEEEEDSPPGQEEENTPVRLEGLSTHDFVGKLQSAQRNLEKKFQVVMADFFQNQKKAVAGVVDTNDIDEEDRRRIQRRLIKQIAESEQELIDLAVEHLGEIIRTGADIAAEVVGPDFELDNADVMDFIEAYTLKFAKGINDNTERRIRGILRRAFAENWPVTKIRDKIREQFNDFSRSRAEMIARSEVIRASNAGSKMAWSKANVTELQWLAAEGDACPFCEELDGTVVGIKESFIRQGEEIRAKDKDGNDIQLRADYEDINHPPAHPNCRCTIIPVV